MLVKLQLTLLMKNPSKLDEAKQVDVEQAVAEQISEKVRDMVDEAGYAYVGGHLDITWASKQDALLYTPRKKHLRDKDTGHQVCDVPWISRRNLVEDEEQVTCKRCLQVIKERTPKKETRKANAEGRADKGNRKRRAAGDPGPVEAQLREAAGGAADPHRAEPPRPADDAGGAPRRRRNRRSDPA